MEIHQNTTINSWVPLFQSPNHQQWHCFHQERVERRGEETITTQSLSPSGPSFWFTLEYLGRSWGTGVFRFLNWLQREVEPIMAHGWGVHHQSTWDVLQSCRIGLPAAEQPFLHQKFCLYLTKILLNHNPPQKSVSNSVHWHFLT